MTVATLTKAQLAEGLVVDAASEIRESAVANLLRAPLARWGLSPKHALLKYAREQIAAAGVEGFSGIPRVLARLVALGECDEVHIGGDVYVAPAAPRWMDVGDSSGAYLSVFDLPEGIVQAVSGAARDIVRRISVRSDEDAARLQLAGVNEISMAEWLTPIGYLRHASRRLGSPARSDEITLSVFWDILEAELSQKGLPLGPDAEVRAITGAPGGFFGRYDAADAVGRWTTSAPDGTWCAFRRGYGEAHWHPTILAVNGGERRAFDLFDADEWHWALLARGRRLGSDDGVLRANDSMQLTFRAPRQLQTAMDLLGPQTAPWTWSLQPQAPDIWACLD